jgi:hypothetical protein
MHAKIAAEDITFVLLKNRKSFQVVKGSFQDHDDDTVTFDYFDTRRFAERQRITVARELVAAMQGPVGE